MKKMFKGWTIKDFLAGAFLVLLIVLLPAVSFNLAQRQTFWQRASGGGPCSVAGTQGICCLTNVCNVRLPGDDVGTNGCGSAWPSPGSIWCCRSCYGGTATPTPSGRLGQSCTSNEDCGGFRGCEANSFACLNSTCYRVACDVGTCQSLYFSTGWIHHRCQSGLKYDPQDPKLLCCPESATSICGNYCQYYKSWTIEAEPVCAGGKTPTVKTRMRYWVWPPPSPTPASSVTWNDFLKTDFKAGIVTQKIEKFHYGANGYAFLETEGGVKLAPTGAPPHSQIVYEEFFRPPEGTTERVWMAGIRGELFAGGGVPSGTYRIKFLVPDQYCQAPSPTGRAPTTRPPVCTPTPTGELTPTPELSPTPTGALLPAKASLFVKAYFEGVAEPRKMVASVRLWTKDTTETIHVVFDRTLILGESGETGEVRLNGVATGKKYDVVVVSQGFLSKWRSIDLVEGRNPATGSLDFGILKTGDLNGDDMVNGLDWSLMKLDFSHDGES